MDVKGLSIIIGTLALSAALTWAVSATIGMRIARRHPAPARLVTASIAPALLIGYGIYVFIVDGRAHPESDWPAMAVVGGVMLAGVSLMATIPVTAVTLRRHRLGRP
jgi:hypothetical protein